MMYATLVTTLITASISMSPQASWPTLATVLRHYGVPVQADVKATDQITSFEVFDDDRRFAIGYYDLMLDGLLHDLHVRLFDKKVKVWHSATFEGIGSVLSIRHHGGRVYVGGHSSPSGGPLLVLSDDLRLKRRLDGWIVLELPDGRVLFKRSMRHFAPMHAEVLAIYDPVANRDETFYPSGADNDRGAERVPGTDLWMDRSFGEIAQRADGRSIEFTVTEQRIRLDADKGSQPAGPEVRRRVICTATRRVPVCREAPIAPRAADRAPR